MVESFWIPKNRIKTSTKLSKRYPRRTATENRLVDKHPYRDSDRDRVLNYFDCKPLNKKKRDAMAEIQKAGAMAAAAVRVPIQGWGSILQKSGEGWKRIGGEAYEHVVKPGISAERKILETAGGAAAGTVKKSVAGWRALGEHLGIVEKKPMPVPKPIQQYGKQINPALLQQLKQIPPAAKVIPKSEVPIPKTARLPRLPPGYTMNRIEGKDGSTIIQIIDPSGNIIRQQTIPTIITSPFKGSAFRP